MSQGPRTLLDKLWEAHLVSPPTKDAPAVLYIDLHLIHEVTSPQAFALLRERGLGVRRPDRTFATMDHAIPTRLGSGGGRAPALGAAAEQIGALERNCRDFGIRLFPVGSDRQGIVHVIGPELGLTHTSWPPSACCRASRSRSRSRWRAGCPRASPPRT